MRKIYINITSFLTEDIGLSSSQSLGSNLRLVVYYTSTKIVSNTREHSINNTAEKITQVQFGLTSLFA